MKWIQVVVLLLMCTGCWDMREINHLALVEMTAADMDPKTKRITAYYQVLNPTGTSSRQAGPAKASVYTYVVSEQNLGLLTEKSGTTMSRMLFTAHLQCYVFSERFARDGLLELVNYLELNTERRTNVYAVVTDAPIQNVMESFTPLDRVPGRNLRLLMDWQAKTFGMTRKLTQLEDIVKGVPLSRPTIIPILHYNRSSPASQTDRVDHINATEPGFEISEGAVFIRAKMVGKIDQHTKKMYYVLNGDARRCLENIKVNGAKVDLETRNIQVKRKWGPKRLHITIRVNLRVLYNQQMSPLTLQNTHEIEQAFNKTLVEQSNQFVRLAKDNNWDLLGIGDTKQGRGKWRDFDVSFEVSSKAVMFGNTRTPYQ
ncbi:Ger(x)C family spore germination C-terminal domain-containing protein [Paenibacillus sp. CF384]|uniref:Ger(x)C family spore germination protein n=1 Tax=Paenibacillus sp. CF384 TaxID=1884382 RepID=UPI000895DFED|nr:Ger(x)C family spore germination C-terminal domain-containing protein [Paenibacillus sp. CF384]SDW07627.1 germination protein, Ger(x)C family [Paenibacillus sp. CF384]